MRQGNGEKTSISNGDITDPSDKDQSLPKYVAVGVRFSGAVTECGPAKAGREAGESGEGIDTANRRPDRKAYPATAKVLWQLIRYPSMDRRKLKFSGL
jgi:hypothetical protein